MGYTALTITMKIGIGLLGINTFEPHNLYGTN